MTKLKVGSITLIVNGYYINNGKPTSNVQSQMICASDWVSQRFPSHSKQSTGTSLFSVKD